MANKKPAWVEQYLQSPPPATEGTEFSPETIKRLSEPLKQQK